MLRIVRSLRKLRIAATATDPPPFLLNEQTGDVDLKVVLFGSDPEVVEVEFERLYHTFPKETKTSLQRISAKDAPQAGASYYFQLVLPTPPPVQGRQVRLHLFAGSAPISGPESAVHALHLKEAACVVLLPGDESEVSRGLSALLKRAEVRTRATMIIGVSSKDLEHAYPREWATAPASSVSEAVEKASKELRARLDRARVVPPKP